MKIFDENGDFTEQVAPWVIFLVLLTIIVAGGLIDGWWLKLVG